ncbi:PepSY-associated TM helix domain-containing protein [Rhodococcus sp. AG1013]|uniref:PepSY-associated TM helix domain-containing protein n=1 Tax=unclassified Rhodococcus (in: high G+C Gram-positive bacteria) TaxID=192944 RepID=UPI000E0B64E8|nr:PepSY domain-containing protein [Rhodococcus sp. AG1013]RDI25842.1 putative iron-regulated membrane protein [Rhodococcus sp. AG1013]
MNAPESVGITPAHLPNDPSAESDSKDSSPPGALRRLVLRLHFYAGILVAPFLIVAAVSGGLYAVAPTLEQFVYRDYLHVETTGPAAPVSDQVEAARAQRPDLAVSAVRPAVESGDTTRVLFTDPTLGESERLAVFVDPVTARPVGELVVYGSSSALPMRTWISQLHRNLHLGEPGRIYSELAASWLWVIALGGVYLWVRRYRTVRARAGAATPRLWTVKHGARGRNRALGWHGAIGLWIAVGLVFLSATGLTWSKYAGEHVTDLRTSLGWTTPSVSKKLGATDTAPAGGHDGHGGHEAPAAGTGMLDNNVGRLDDVLAVAAGAGVTGAVEASIPSAPDTAFTVAQTRQPWQFATDVVAVDGATGQITDTSRFADWPLAAKLTFWGIGVHMGILFGLLNQIVLVALAAALLVMIVLGYTMWWRRRPTRGAQRWGRPPTRGAVRGLHPAAAAALVACTVLVGWFVPLLGLSLIGFVAVDIVVGVFQRRRASTGVTE